MDKSFIILCASIVFNNQLSLFDNEFEDNKQGRNLAFRQIFENIMKNGHIKVNPKFSEYIFLFKSRLDNDLLYFQLAKKKEIEKYELIDNNFQQMAVSSYPPLDIFVNLKNQQMAVELKDFVNNEESLLRTIQKLFSLFIKQENFSIFFNIVEDKREFWQLVDSKNVNQINEIEFEMIVPNFFGVAGDAKDLVEGAKEKVNADTVLLKFKNKKGSLKARMSDLESYVNYSVKSGSWKLKIKNEGKIRTIKSSDFSKKKNIEKSILDVVSSYNTQNGPDELVYQKCLKRIKMLFEGDENE